VPRVAPPLVVATYLGMFLLAARAAGVHASPQQVLPLALVVLLAAAIPLNVGGWGPREGVAAWVFAAGGWGAGAGTAVATAFGVMVLVSTLPGAVVLLADVRRSRADTRTAAVEPAGEVVHSGAHSGVREDGARNG
jgi:hypothetical protein